jgi:wyosine [tRNA(Phe)-imidazoG37] synthetase (radical SAM superfamily)
MDTPESADPCFGPVPSRRLGRSLGVNNVPYKTCTYSCVYCQLGPTASTSVQRRAFRSAGTIVDAVRTRLSTLASRGDAVDYVTFVPDGEPTLDLGLDAALVALEGGETPTAVITNASLLSDPAVVRALIHADWVSLKVDAADEATWRAVNRPDPALRFEDVVAGALQLANVFRGTLVTETMLVAGVNDHEAQVRAIADRVARIGPRLAYLAIPTRPAGEAWVRPPNEDAIARAYAVFRAKGIETELLVGHPEPLFTGAARPSDAILRITAVHPLRRIELQRILDESDATWSCVDALVASGALRCVDYRGEEFFVRALPDAARPAADSPDT